MLGALGRLCAMLLLAYLAHSTALVAPTRHPTHVPRLPLPLCMARPREYAKKAQVVESPKPSPELKEKQKTTAIIVGVSYFAQFAIIPYVALARLGLVKAPPLNTFTDITNAAMEQAIASGELQPIMATAWAQGFWVDMFKEYYSSGQPDDFVATWCAFAEHSSYCSAAGL
eukprot:scaffold43532_cov34-Tisochrysis_lutea.AAC.1